MISPLIRQFASIFQYFKGTYSLITSLIYSIVDPKSHSKRQMTALSDPNKKEYLQPQRTIIEEGIYQARSMANKQQFILFQDNQSLINAISCKLQQIFYTQNRLNPLLMFRTLQQFTNWGQIRPKLQDLARQKCSPAEIVQLLARFKFYSDVDQNKPSDRSSGKFVKLVESYYKQLPEIFSKVARFVLERSKHEIPLFLQGQQKAHTFKKETVIFLYCSMMLCLTSRQQFDSSMQARSNFNYLLDFSYIFDQEENKTKNVIEYIKKEIDNTQAYDEKMTIHRHVEKRDIEDIIQENKQRPMSPFQVESNQASIQDFYGDLKADFANKFLGGGALLSGCVQQQIMFANHPELFTAQLLCEVMKPNECIFLSGYKKYFKNSGYGWTTAFDGTQTHQYKYDQNRQAAEYITAIDAIDFGHEHMQFNKYAVDRQLLKAYCGFSFNVPSTNRVVTGNWGCGAFGGNLRIKFLVQWLACSLVGKEMIYCPFGERQVVYEQKLLERISQLRIGQTYNLIQKACNNLLEKKQPLDIYRAIEELL